MRITKDQVREVARLARLHFSDEDASEMAGELSVILDYIDTLNELDTEGIPPMQHASSGENVFRADVPIVRLSKDTALSNAPDADADFFRVPKVISQS